MCNFYSIITAKWSQDEDKGQNSSLLNAVGMNDADKIEKISKSKPRHEPASKRKLYMNLKCLYIRLFKLITVYRFGQLTLGF